MGLSCMGLGVWKICVLEVMTVLRGTPLHHKPSAMSGSKRNKLSIWREHGGPPKANHEQASHPRFDSRILWHCGPASFLRNFPILFLGFCWKRKDKHQNTKKLFCPYPTPEALEKKNWQKPPDIKKVTEKKDRVPQSLNFVACKGVPHFCRADSLYEVPIVNFGDPTDRH